jgi:hypothetical protein
MNCFDWQNRASDYLDGALIASLKREADEHLESCDSCNTRHKHYRLVLTSIASQPRNALPVAIRKTPLALAVRDRKIRLSDRIGLWSTLPWYARIPLEGAGIVLLISLAISAGPRLRALYERRMERSLTEYSEGFGDADSAATTATLGRGNVVAAADPNAAQAAVDPSSDDFAGGEGGGDAAGDSDSPVKAGAAETWRFNLKTDSPLDVRTKIQKILTDLKVPSSTPGIGGIEAPGGIQFDILVPQGVVVDLKQALEKIAPPPMKELEDSPIGETFTWYKNKSKHPLPAGQTHVVIWLSQI